jgi:hypothetical protein
MTREQREAWIDQLRAESAANLEDIARREAINAVELENQECDALLARLAQRRQETEQHQAASDLVIKDFYSSERQAPRPELADVFSSLQLRVLQKAFRIERGHVKQRQAEALSALRTKLDAIEAMLAELEQRLSELESSDNESGSGYAG